jgi:hypothetical protein
VNYRKLMSIVLAILLMSVLAVRISPASPQDVKQEPEPMIYETPVPDMEMDVEMLEMEELEPGMEMLEAGKEGQSVRRIQIPEQDRQRVERFYNNGQFDHQRLEREIGRNNTRRARYYSQHSGVHFVDVMLLFFLMRNWGSVEAYIGIPYPTYPTYPSYYHSPSYYYYYNPFPPIYCYPVYRPIYRPCRRRRPPSYYRPPCRKTNPAGPIYSNPCQPITGPSTRPSRPSNPTGFIRPSAPSNPTGYTRPSAPSNPTGFTRPSNPPGFTRPSRPPSPSRLTRPLRSSLSRPMMRAR